MMVIRPSGLSRKLLLRSTLLILLVAGSLPAQTGTTPQNGTTPPAVPPGPPVASGRGRGGRGGGGGTPVDAVVSPEVHADRSVTLRFRAPLATQVDIVGELMQGKGPQPMTRDPNGLWSATLAPVPPEIWSYNFRVQGIDIPDPSNPAVKPVPPGFAMSSFVEVPGDGAAFYDSRRVPHGDVRMTTYESKAMGVTRALWIYTPPGYDKSKAKYPVVFLLHGNGEGLNGWVMNGRVNIILDNLIADGKARPMIVVMPQGHALQAPNVGPLVRITGESGMFSPRFPTDLLDGIIPMVEKDYRVIANADNRALAGLSMGGGQALSIGFSHPELFHYVLGFSAAINGQFLNIDEPLKLLTANPAATNARLRLLWISTGKQDFLRVADENLDKLLTEKGVRHTFVETEGAHVWSVWRNNLFAAAPLLFKEK